MGLAPVFLIDTKGVALANVNRLFALMRSLSRIRFFKFVKA